MKISVILTSYNYAQYIEEAILSVINQTYENWELIIVDDGSSDNSVEIIESFCEKNPKIKLFQHPNKENKGLKESLLLGLKHASGDWTAFLESDDFFEHENLEKKVEIIKDAKMHRGKEAKLIFNKVNFLAEEKRKQQKHHKTYEKTQEKLSKMKFPKNMFYDFSVDNMILTFSCAMVETNILKTSDFNTPIDSSLDRWLWIHLAKDNDFYYLNEELTNWRLHSDSYITRQKKPAFYFPQISAYWDIYKREKSPKFFLFILNSFIKAFFAKIIRFFNL